MNNGPMMMNLTEQFGYPDWQSQEWLNINCTEKFTSVKSKQTEQISIFLLVVITPLFPFLTFQSLLPKPKK